jgi:uncharacterized protein (TIRG00374 family)
MTGGSTSVAIAPHWIRRVALFVAAGATIYLGAILLAGAKDSLAAIGRLGLTTILAGTALASTAYLIRFARWHWLIRRLGTRVPAFFNLRVYLAGLALTPTPGKAGEVLRSALLLHRGVSVPGSIAAFLADRGSDVVGMAMLGAGAALFAGSRESSLEAIAVLLLVATTLFAVAVRRGLISRFNAPGPLRSGRWLRAVRALVGPLEYWATLWSPARSIAYALFAVVAYGIQALVLSFYVQALGSDLSAVVCIEIFAVAMLLGAASMVPGGLGATEAALVYQLTRVGMPTPDAVAAALSLRLSTLWFAILLGILALLSFANRSSQ